MTFMKKLFGREEKKTIEPMHGAPAAQQDLDRQVHADTRKRMEAELDNARSLRGATTAPAPAEAEAD